MAAYPSGSGRGSARTRRRAALAIGAAMLAACGGGGGGGDDVSAPLALPTDNASAIDFQYQQVVATRKAVEEILAADKAAMQALLDGRLADWDRHWIDTYPVLLERLRVATENLHASEDHVHRLVYGLGPTTPKDLETRKFVPLPIVLVAVATITGIYAAEKSGYQERLKQVTEEKYRELVDTLRQAYQNSGMSAPVADQRAKNDAGGIQTLQQIQTAIETAKTFVIENFTIPAFTSYLPDDPSSLLDLNDIRKQLGEIKGNVEAIFTTQECRTLVAPQSRGAVPYTPDPERSAPAAVASGTSIGTCRVYFCSTEDASCEDLPAGNWEAAIFAPGRLRDVEQDVSAANGAPASVQATLVAAADIEKPPPVAQCSTVQNAGGDAADMRNVPLGRTSGSFSLSYEMYSIKDQIRVIYDGKTIFDSGCVSGGKTQLIPYSGLASFVTVQVTPNCSGNTSGTAWNYTLACPSN